MSGNYEIDIVILWVDGNDPEWQKERNKYIAKADEDAGINRYRDWDNLQYLFRGIEKFMPWVRNVYLVTCGHYPKWLNLSHPKLKLVKHSDFIPEEYLPTFSSQSIDLHLHRISGLSEHFIYFNDDTFILNAMEKSDFFRNGLPCDMFSERAIGASQEKGEVLFDHTLLNNMQLLGRHFGRKEVLRQNRKKILTLRYGKTFFYNCIAFVLPYKKWYGLYMHHLPMGYLKSCFEEIWELEETVLIETVRHKFRTPSDVNQYIFRDWALAKGEFFPYNMDKIGRLYSIPGDVDTICNVITKQKLKLICINDNLNNQNFEEIRNRINACFESILPQKSKYEV